MYIQNNEIVLTGKFLKIASLADERFVDVESPKLYIDELNKLESKPDIFTFIQRLPDKKPIFNHFMEWESIAAIKTDNYDAWWQNKVQKVVRRRVRKIDQKYRELIGEPSAIQQVLSRNMEKRAKNFKIQNFLDPINRYPKQEPAKRYLYQKNKKYSIQLGIIAGGIVGNLIDRILYGYVIDFINFSFWPIFNIADSATFVGVIWLVFLLWKSGDDLI